MAEKSELEMEDFTEIADFEDLDKAELISKVRALADNAAALAERKLTKALAKFEHVIFATHYPPFPEAAVTKRGLSSGHWLPWFSSKAMGDTLLRVAKRHDRQRVSVLCGHTHGRGEFSPLPNLTVYTGKAVYGDPQLERVFLIR